MTQTVWNELSGSPQGYGIGDIDIVYHNSSDLSGEKEKACELKLREALHDLPFSIDVTNEARVHLWYEDKFGKEIKPYQTVEHAIDTWPTTASAVGVKRVSGQYTIYAPYGLQDLFDMVVRPNKKLVTRQVYESKALKWMQRWPMLKIVPWESDV
ncbi:nucleotidyltransferase family protein [Halobacillus sp. B23F22_1]|uniref:nucleotidyltransferase family protein n=1 Tax=Halobacillus sp. B23F22_1 TaxID=3459514 RepID=UPI00373E4212